MPRIKNAPLHDLTQIPVNNPLGLYLRQMTDETLLSAEEELQLAQTIEAGRIAEKRQSEYGLPEASRSQLAAMREAGQAARTRLIRANTRLVVSIAKKYRGRGLQFLDLIQEGNVGLITAVDRFDYRRGNRFSTYATWWIRQAVSRALANHGRTIRLPAHLVGHIYRLYRATHQLTQAEGHEPMAEEIAEHIGLPPERVRELLAISRHPLYFEQPAGAEFDSQLGEFIEDVEALNPDEAVGQSTLRKELDQALELLTPREARILRLRFGLVDGEPRTLLEVAGILGLSRERIRQLQNDALNRLRSSHLVAPLRHYLGR